MIWARTVMEAEGRLQLAVPGSCPGSLGGYRPCGGLRVARAGGHPPEHLRPGGQGHHVKPQAVGAGLPAASAGGLRCGGPGGRCWTLRGGWSQLGRVQPPGLVSAAASDGLPSSLRVSSLQTPSRRALSAGPPWLPRDTCSDMVARAPRALRSVLRGQPGPACPHVTEQGV